MAKGLKNAGESKASREKVMLQNARFVFMLVNKTNSQKGGHLCVLHSHTLRLQVGRTGKGRGSSLRF